MPQNTSPLSLRELLLNTPSCIIEVDVQGNIRYVTTPVQKILGWTAQELKDQPLVTIIPEELREKHTAGFYRWCKSGRLTVSKKIIRTNALKKNNTIEPIEMSLGSYRGLEGDLRVIAIIMGTADIIEWN